MFESLRDKLQGIFDRLGKRCILRETETFFKAVINKFYGFFSAFYTVSAVFGIDLVSVYNNSEIISLSHKNACETALAYAVDASDNCIFLYLYPPHFA